MSNITLTRTDIHRLKEQVLVTTDPIIQTFNEQQKHLNEQCKEDLSVLGVRIEKDHSDKVIFQDHYLKLSEGIHQYLNTLQDAIEPHNHISVQTDLTKEEYLNQTFHQLTEGLNTLYDDYVKREEQKYTVFKNSDVAYDDTASYQKDTQVFESSFKLHADELKTLHEIVSVSDHHIKNLNAKLSYDFSKAVLEQKSEDIKTLYETGVLESQMESQNFSKMNKGLAELVKRAEASDTNTLVINNQENHLTRDQFIKDVYLVAKEREDGAKSFSTLIHQKVSDLEGRPFQEQEIYPPGFQLKEAPSIHTLLEKDPPKKEGLDLMTDKKTYEQGLNQVNLVVKQYETQIQELYHQYETLDPDKKTNTLKALEQEQEFINTLNERLTPYKEALDSESDYVRIPVKEASHMEPEAYFETIKERTINTFKQRQEYLKPVIKKDEQQYFKHARVTDPTRFSKEQASQTYQQTPHVTTDTTYKKAPTVSKTSVDMSHKEPTREMSL